tara:strand:- start:431 stop:625 length:195 start_codon:yes stop_codon:yes gene_type:complete
MAGVVLAERESDMEMKIKRLVEARNKVISEMNEVCPAWQPKRLRALQVAASKLADEIGKVKKAA